MTKVAVKRVEPLWLSQRPAARPTRRPVDPSADFAEFVRARLDFPILRYSDRLAMLKEAQRRGIGRFEANLVIAKVLHEEGMGQSYELKPKASWLPAVMVVVAIQGMILLGLWWMLG